MKRLVAVLLVLIVAFVALALYLGWFQVSSVEDGDRSNVTISVDRAKIEADKNAAIERAQRLGEDLKSKPAPPPPEGLPPTAPPAEEPEEKPEAEPAQPAPPPA